MKHTNHEHHEKQPGSTPMAQDIPGTPETVWEQINKYGTYNIQPTQDGDWAFPTIAQGPYADELSARRISTLSEVPGPSGAENGADDR
jgi:hypothetical protein